MIDKLVVPQGLKEHIPKPDRHQILHRLLAEIMVDPIDLPFVKILRQRRVQRFRRFKIVTKRLLNHDPAALGRQAFAPDPFRQIAKEAWCD